MRVPTSVWLFLVLTVLTCIIAYWADNLGKNLGKKRISLFGLRPRQTATLISMASSVAIMLLTLLVLSYLNQDFKNALFRSGRLNENNQKLRAENRTLENQRERSRAEVQKLKFAAAKSKSDAQQAGEDEEKAKSETQVARLITKRARFQLASTRKQLTGAKSAVAAAQTSLNEAKNSLKSAQQKATDAAASEREAQSRSNAAEATARAAEKTARAAANNAKAAQSQKAVAVAQANVARKIADTARRVSDQAKRAADNAKRELNSARNKLQGAQDDLQSAQDNLQNTQENFRTVQESTKTIFAANREAIRQQAKLERQNSELFAYNEELRLRSLQIIGRFATGDISISFGQVFAERILQPGQSEDAIQMQLNALQKDALLELQKPPISATSAELLTLPTTIDNKPVSFDAKKLQLILIENLRGVEVPVAVRWVAARNHATGEPQIDGRLVSIEVRTVVPEGTILAQDTLAAGQSDAAIFSRLLALTDKARGAARALGVTPPLSPQQPNFFASGTNERVFAALREIQSRGGARVTLVADAPLSSVAPPPVRFVLEELESAAASTRTPAADASPAPSS